MEDKLDILEKGNEKMKLLAKFRRDVKKMGKKTLLFGITGMECSLFSLALVNQLLSRNEYNLIVILTQHAMKFISEEEVQKIAMATKHDVCFLTLIDKDEWNFWSNSLIVLHIYLRNMVDGLFIAPLCPNNLAKLANGFCDDLLVFAILIRTNRHVYAELGI